MSTKTLTRPLEVKEVGEDGSFEGYGSVFDVVDSYRDIVMPGAFEKSINHHKEKGSMPALLWQHDAKTPIGVWKGMSEDERGLKLTGQLALGTQKGKEAYELLKMKAVNGLSIGFSVPKGGQEWQEDREVNHLKEVNLWETSVVTFPANQEAQVTGVRNEDLLDPRKLERLLRDVGLSQSQAKSLMSGGHKALTNQRDVDEELAEALKTLTNTLRGH